MKKKLTFIISDIDRWQSFEWYAKELRDRYELSFILINEGDSYFSRYLEKNGHTHFFVKSRKKVFLPIVIWGIGRFVIRIKPDIVHCHFLSACITGLTASWILRIPKRIYTRHHSVYHHRYKPFGVYYDRWSNYTSTHIIAISELVKDVLIEKENVSRGKIHLIHHGFKLETFRSISDQSVGELRLKYDLGVKRPIIGVVSRYEELKGIQYIIPAFEKLLSEFPNACLMLFNARGRFGGVIKTMLSNVPAENYKTIPFEHDIQSVYRLFDIFVHVPIDAEVEAFGQIYVEALASGVPSVFTMSGVTKEFIEDGNNAIVVPFKDSEAIYQSIVAVLSDPNLQKKLSAEGRKSVEIKFSLELMISKMEILYEH